MKTKHKLLVGFAALAVLSPYLALTAFLLAICAACVIVIVMALAYTLR